MSVNSSISGDYDDPQNDYKKVSMMKFLFGDRRTVGRMGGKPLFDSIQSNPFCTHRNRHLLRQHPMTSTTAETLVFIIPINTLFTQHGMWYNPNDSIIVRMNIHPSDQLARRVIRCNPDASYGTTDVPSTISFTMTNLSVHWIELDSASKYYVDLIQRQRELQITGAFFYLQPLMLQSYPESTSVTTISDHNSQLKHCPKAIMLYKIRYNHLGTETNIVEDCKESSGGLSLIHI